MTWVMVRGKDARLLYVELKTETGVMTKEQQAWMADMCAVAAESEKVEAYLWRPRHWRDGTIERVLR